MRDVFNIPDSVPVGASLQTTIREKVRSALSGLTVPVSPQSSTDPLTHSGTTPLPDTWKNKPWGCRIISRRCLCPTNNFTAPSPFFFLSHQLRFRRSPQLSCTPRRTDALRCNSGHVVRLHRRRIGGIFYSHDRYELRNDDAFSEEGKMPSTA